MLLITDDGVSFTAHRELLERASDTLADLLGEDGVQDGPVPLPDVVADDLFSLLLVLYSSAALGNMKSHVPSLLALARVADRLACVDVLNAVDAAWASQLAPSGQGLCLTADNASSWFVCSQQLGLPLLKAACIAYMGSNLPGLRLDGLDPDYAAILRSAGSCCLSASAAAKCRSDIAAVHETVEAGYLELSRPRLIVRELLPPVYKRNSKMVLYMQEQLQEVYEYFERQAAEQDTVQAKLCALSAALEALQP